jgi:hypothetical protein
MLSSATRTEGSFRKRCTAACRSRLSWLPSTRTNPTPRHAPPTSPSRSDAAVPLASDASEAEAPEAEAAAAEAPCV